MREAPRIKNVVDACMVPRRAERLDALLEQLEQCQKALQVHPCHCTAQSCFSSATRRDANPQLCKSL